MRGRGRAQLDRRGGGVRHRRRAAVLAVAARGEAGAALHRDRRRHGRAPRVRGVAGRARQAGHHRPQHGPDRPLAGGLVRRRRRGRHPPDSGGQLPTSRPDRQRLRAPHRRTRRHDRPVGPPGRRDRRPRRRSGARRVLNYDIERAGPARTSLRPFEIVQPDGPSFTVDSNLLHWENWRLRSRWTVGLVCTRSGGTTAPGAPHPPPGGPQRDGGPYSTGADPTGRTPSTPASGAWAGS